MDIQKTSNQEYRYRALTENLFHDIYNEYNMQHYFTPVFTGHSIDVESTLIPKRGSQRMHLIEVKQRTAVHDKQYYNAILKCSKLKRMEAYRQKREKSSTINCKLLYCVWRELDGYVYIFDLDNIDFKDIKIISLPLKITQYDDTSKEVMTDCYSIPYEKAVMKRKISDYYGNTQVQETT